LKSVLPTAHGLYSSTYKTQKYFQRLPPICLPSPEQSEPFSVVEKQ